MMTPKPKPQTHAHNARKKVSLIYLFICRPLESMRRKFFHVTPASQMKRVSLSLSMDLSNSLPFRTKPDFEPHLHSIHSIRPWVGASLSDVYLVKV